MTALSEYEMYFNLEAEVEEESLLPSHPTLCGFFDSKSWLDCKFALMLENQPESDCRGG